MPRGNVYLEALGGWSSLGGPFIRGEAGAVLGKHIAAFLAAQRNSDESRVIGGARITW